MIAKKKKVIRNFVIKWGKSPNQDFTKDNRGWPKGKREKWAKEDEERIRSIYNLLSQNPLEFYTGATAIEQEWRKRYPTISSLPLRTIGQILKDLDLSKNKRRNRHKGAARYLCYSEYTIYHLLEGRILEVDFIGKKYITARSGPLNFIGFSFKKEPKLRYFKRVSGQTAGNLIEQSGYFFQRFSKADFIKIDNCIAARQYTRQEKYLQNSRISFRKPGVPLFSCSKETLVLSIYRGK